MSTASRSRSGCPIDSSPDAAAVRAQTWTLPGGLYGAVQGSASVHGWPMACPLRALRIRTVPRCRPANPTVGSRRAHRDPGRPPSHGVRGSGRHGARSSASGRHLLILHNDLPPRTEIGIVVGGVVACAAGRRALVATVAQYAGRGHRAAHPGNRRGARTVRPGGPPGRCHRAGGAGDDRSCCSTMRPCRSASRDGQSWAIGHIARANAVADAARTSGVRRRAPGGEVGSRARDGRD